jgi:hypothetical protein
MLVSIDECPVCKSPANLAELCPDAISREAGLRYLDPLARKHGIALTEITKSINAYRCSYCRAYFLNPWFSEDARNEIFLAGHPIHNMGWSNFLERLTNNETPQLPLSTADLLGVLESKVGKISSYAELGCPFMGLLLRSVDSISLERWLKINKSFGSTPRFSARQLPQAISDFMALSTISSNIVKIVTRLRFWRRRALTQKPSVCDIQRFEQTYYIPVPSSKGWGMNCAGFGESCTAMSHTTLGAKVITISNLVESSDRSIDLIGIFLTLDHQDSPLDLLKTCLSKAKAVLVLTHEKPFSSQHQVGLGHDFFLRLPEVIPDVRIDYVASRKSDHLFLLSNRTES